MTSYSDLSSFFIKRLFRIFPLFWLVVTATLLYQLLQYIFHDPVADFSIYKIFLNYSLLFGFVNPNAYLPTGGWSIGNEMVFYAVFPCIFLVYNRWKLIIPLSILISIVLGLYYSFFLMDATLPLAGQWDRYINPFNQMYFFMFGILIGVYGESVKKVASQPLCYLILTAALISFWLYPASGDKIQIATGVNRAFLSTCSILFVLFVFLSNPKFNHYVSKPLSIFGESCYSIYLLHPLAPLPIFFVLNRLNMGKFLVIGYFLSFLFTLIVSWFIFNYFEKPMMNIGKYVSQRITP